MAYKKYDAYHLGMQPEEVKEALQGGGGGGNNDISFVKGKFNITASSEMTAVEIPAKTFWHDFYKGSLVYIPESFQISPNASVEVDVFVIAQNVEGVLFADSSPFISDDASEIFLRFISGTGIGIIGYEGEDIQGVFFNGFYVNFTVGEK